MKLAVSNIAWPADAEPAAAQRLSALGVRGVEVAPTAVWPRPLDAAPDLVARYRDGWAERGIAVVALQALLFGREDLTLFDTADRRAETLEYLTGMVRLCARLGGHALVFGSPRNRRRGALGDQEAAAIAVPFFRALGQRAADAGVAFCIEANPPEYGCDFVTTSADAVALACEVDSPGFGVHLDAGGMTLSQEPVDAAVAAALPWCRHFHVSEPSLEPVGTGRADHASFGAALARSRYDGWISIEMRSRGGAHWADDVERAVSAARRDYARP